MICVYLNLIDDHGMHSERRKPVSDQIQDLHREHFYEVEERGPEAERGEGRIYDTKMSRLMDLMTESLPDVPEQKREQFEGLIQEIHDSTFSYIEARVAHIKAAKTGDQGAIMTSDRSRRAAHIRLTDAIAIASRNFVKEVEGWQVAEDMVSIVGSSQDEQVRARVARSAIDYIWQILDEEEAKARRAH
jgi:hypothetical protein